MRRIGWVVVVAAAAGCLPAERPQALIVCHNANCARATDPHRDDTLAMLDASLALTYRGRPVIDGMEIDTLWDRRRSVCIFAHDFGHAPEVPELGMDAADRIARHIRESRDVSWSGDAFFTKVEIKNEVLADGTGHSPAEIEAHFQCVFDMADVMIAAARDRGITFELGFDSEVVPLLRALTAHPRWPGKTPDPKIRLRLITGVNVGGLEPSDLASLEQPGSSAGIDILAFHATRTPTGVVRAYADLGAELMIWMLDAAPETLAAVHEYEPSYVVTNEAMLFRRWEEQ